VSWRDTTVTTRFDEAIPPTKPRVSLRPDRVFQVQRGIRVSWSATDAGTGVASYDVHYDNPLFPTYWRTRTTETRSRFVGVPGTTYCFHAAARDRVENLSDHGREECTTFPADDRWLEADAAWNRMEGADYYVGTFTASSTRGATLSSDWFGAYRIVLVAERCPTCGAVDVWWKRGTSDFRRVATISLQAPTRRLKQVIPVITFDRLIVGKARIVVRTSGQPVRIDGLGFSAMTERQANR